MNRRHQISLLAALGLVVICATVAFTFECFQRRTNCIRIGGVHADQVDVWLTNKEWLTKGLEISRLLDEGDAGGGAAQTRDFERAMMRCEDLLRYHSALAAKIVRGAPMVDAISGPAVPA